MKEILKWFLYLIVGLIIAAIVGIGLAVLNNPQ